MGSKMRKKDQTESVWDTLEEFHKAHTLHDLYERIRDPWPLPGDPKLGSTSLAAASTGAAVVAIGTTAMAMGTATMAAPVVAGAAVIGLLVLGIQSAAKLWD